MVTRRVVLKLAGSLGAGLGASSGSGIAAESTHWMDPAARRTLAAYFDALVPGGSVAADMDRRMASLRSDGERRQLLEMCAWLEAEARSRGGPGFADGTDSLRDAVLERASQLPGAEPVRRFFETTRTVALSQHYSRAASWDSLGYDGPPQPRGFADYTQPLKRRTD